jgi:hypothetical protein
VFSHWPVYGLAITGPLGFLLNQDAFQRGILIAPVLTVITTCDPVVSVALAHFWLDERLNSSPAGIAGTVATPARDDRGDHRAGSPCPRGRAAVGGGRRFCR